MSVTTDTEADATAQAAAVTAPPADVRVPYDDLATGERIRNRDPLYWDIVEWLDDEATVLDDQRTMDWAGSYLAQDLEYRMPVRQNRLRDDPKSQFSGGMFHYDEDYSTLFLKVMRLATTASPWAENPLSRTRRFVSNVKVYRTPKEDEFGVVSSLLITRTRYTEETQLFLSMERRDLLRRDGDSFKVARRHILLDQTTVGWPNLAIFF